MVFTRFEGRSALSPTQWRDLHTLLPESQTRLGLPAQVRTADGRTLQGLQAANYWHTVRKEISRDQSGELRFASSSLQALRLEEDVLATQEAIHELLAARQDPRPAAHMDCLAGSLQLEEVLHAIRSCKGGAKAPGPDLIPYEAFVYGGDIAELLLFSTLHAVLGVGNTPPRVGHCSGPTTP